MGNIVFTERFLVFVKLVKEKENVQTRTRTTMFIITRYL